MDSKQEDKSPEKQGRPDLSMLKGESNGDSNNGAQGKGKKVLVRLRSLSDDNDLLDYKEM